MNIRETIEFIKHAHNNQKYGNLPYWTHPYAVAMKGFEEFYYYFEEDFFIAALLHDVVEDTPYGLDELRSEGYNPNILKIVELVTKDKNLTYFENIQRIIDSGNLGAMMVKWADNNVNFNGDKSHWDRERAEKSNAKYEKSMNMLMVAIKEILEK